LGCKRTLIRCLASAILFVATAWIVPTVQGATTTASDSAKQMRLQAKQAEENAQWLKAAELYEQLLAGNRNSVEFRGHYQKCLRRAQQMRRQYDLSYRHQFEHLTLDNALKVYLEVLTRLKNTYVDKEKATGPVLFREGIKELQNGLTDPAFCRLYLRDTQSDSIRAFREQVLSHGENEEVSGKEDAQSKVRAIALEAKTLLGLNPSLVVLEFACGACAGMDEYTHYLSPDQFAEITNSWKGEYAGVGLSLSLEEREPVVDQVIPGSPAQIGGIKTGDRLLRIGNRLVPALTTDGASELLKGEVDTVIELEVASGTQRPRVVKLKRQLLSLPSVLEPRFLDERLGIGYVQLAGFHESTVQEIDVALAKLQTAGMKVLILDLRGNMGGLFEVAVQVAERFLSSGIIAFTRGQTEEFNTTYRARAMSMLAVPLVVLIDTETASSAEMLAGALKENHRGTLVGQATFGKASIQKVRRLHSVPAAIRMTVARFFSPEGHSCCDQGVSPDIVVDRLPAAADGGRDPQVQAALDVARRLVLDH
jgi:carboxyl-terminal processing protease